MMMRERIAEMLRLADKSWDEVSDPYVNQADAVIRELGLTHDCRYCGGWGPKDD